VAAAGVDDGTPRNAGVAGRRQRSAAGAGVVPVPARGGE